MSKFVIQYLVRGELVLVSAAPPGSVDGGLDHVVVVDLVDLARPVDVAHLEALLQVVVELRVLRGRGVVHGHPDRGWVAA